MKESTKRSHRSLASHHHRRSNHRLHLQPVRLGPLLRLIHALRIRANHRHLRPLDVEGPRRPPLVFTQARSAVIRARFLAQRRQK